MMPVTFLWPQFLWLLLVVPLLIAAYVWLLRRRRKTALNYASLSIIRAAMGPGQSVRRHIPPALFLLALVAMLIAAARPHAVVSLPSDQQTIILAVDVSGSMRATDVKPNRLEAAQAAVKTFLADLPRHIKVGLVAFAGSAHIAQLPTLNREDLNTAIDRFQLQRGTATGNGIMMAMATLFPDAGIDIEALSDERPSRSSMRIGQGPALNDGAKTPAPVPPGSYTSAAVIMLTDGQRTTGVDPLEAAKFAADRGVRVYTVGVGTPEGETIGFEGWSMRARLDDETLKTVAQSTRADYFYAGNATDLSKVYESLSSRFALETKETEISSLVALAAALLAMLSAALSLAWFNRIV
ncbi:Ca-activated chloride channel family protein [Comamonas sp. BIGb0124]|uniref:VWA domain-containing protein n=1 Tax=Comamonas sp. BIGb0124 TaxID=2485130 RepID=UPI000FAD2632|nr:VWA domain-containing protein [Comamonas sp. BIGb0124]ROR24860.1 Ca-activated chloride channel family protein [Comamonas sp. BIGb0124]